MLFILRIHDSHKNLKLTQQTTSDWIAAILSLADWHELLAAKPLANACSNAQLLWIRKQCVCLFVKDGKVMKSLQIPGTTYFFKCVIQSPQLAPGCQISNMLKVNRWLLRLLQLSHCDQLLCVHPSDYVTCVPSATESQWFSHSCEWVFTCCKMLTNSNKQLNDHLKDAHKPPLVTCVLKHYVSHWEPHITPHLLQILWFVWGYLNYFY